MFNVSNPIKDSNNIKKPNQITRDYVTIKTKPNKFAYLCYNIYYAIGDIFVSIQSYPVTTTLTHGGNKMYTILQVTY